MLYYVVTILRSDHDNRSLNSMKKEIGKGFADSRFELAFEINHYFAALKIGLNYKLRY